MLSEGRTEKLKDLSVSIDDLATPSTMCTHTEHGSKIEMVDIYFQLCVDNKVSILKNQSAAQRCLVSLLDMYLSKVPEKVQTSFTAS